MKNFYTFFSKIFILIIFAAVNSFGSINNSNPPIKSSTIACNDTVQVVMNWQCTAIVSPDQLLEGNYPDYGIFLVNILDEDGNPIGNTVSASEVGKVVLAEVLDTQTQNKCWGHIQVVDNYAPVFTCDSVFTTCYSDPVPGSALPHNFRFAFSPNTDIPDEDTLEVEFYVGNIHGAVISDFNVRLDIQHERDLDLAAYLISPGNDTVVLFENLTCGNADFNVVFDDQALKTASDLSAECCPCDPEPSVHGTFKPLGTLSDYIGELPGGNWKLRVVDKNSGYTGVLKKVEFIFKQNGGYVKFPLPTGSANPVSNGFHSYIISYGFDPCGEVLLTYTDNIVAEECKTGLTNTIYRSWRAEDQSGNVSYCTQVIEVLNTGLAFLVYPPNYDNIQNPALSCQPNNPDFYPFPAITGVPTSELCSMIEYNYEDQLVNTCSGSFKVFRHWTISEMCSSDVLEHDQLIMVLDNQGPGLSQPEDFEVGTNGLDCSANIDVTLPEVISDCSDFDKINFSIGYQVLDAAGNPLYPELSTTNLIKLSSTKYRLTNAPVGRYKFTYTATDDCGNKSSVFNFVTVVDNKIPVAICDQHTVVSISIDGVGKLTALAVDDGSHDNCSDITYEVRRIDTYCDPVDTLFQDTITFCCDDINTSQMVELKVTDVLGYYNTCMVSVAIQEKIPPVIICPNPVTITCSEDYNDLELTGEAQAYDNCTIDTIYHFDNVSINQCHVGFVNRTWITKDNNSYQTSCIQKITIVDNGKFVASDIIWPSDKTIYDCDQSYDPSITGDVKFRNEDYCNMVSARYNDEVYNVVQSACKKILRHWEVIDWCNFNELYPEQSTYTHTQIIIFQNNTAPEFSETCHNRTFCSYGECEGQIEYVKYASDDCTPDNELKWSYRIDLENDGIWDIGPILTNNASGIYPNGTHRIGWIVEDGCGNQEKCEELFTVQDCKKPTPLCITQLTTVIMNYNGMATICAEDFNLGQNCSNCNTGSYDNCTPKDELRYSFSETSIVPCRDFTCEDILNGNSVYVTLDVWVWDNEDNKDFCTVYIELQDNEADMCDDDSAVGALVYGFVKDLNNNEMKNVSLDLRSSEISYASTTGNDGKYIFNSIQPENQYNLTASLNDDYLRGVTTLDLVLIQKHILGIKSFDKGYQYVAADVNNSSTVSAADISLIRKAILGQSVDFGFNSKSWNFLNDNNELFENQNILTSIQDNRNIGLNDYNTNIDWTGIKMGDINNSQDFNTSSSSIDFRGDNNIELTVDDLSFKNGEEVKIEMSFEAINELSGAQFTLEFNNEKLVFDHIELNDNLIDDSNVGLNNVNGGLINVSWVKPESGYQESGNLMTLVFKAKTNGNTSEVFRIKDTGLRAEAYNSEFEVERLDLKFRKTEGQNIVNSLYQNIPNPFKYETTISFDMAEGGDMTLEFVDVTGKVIKRINRYFDQGLNSVKVEFDDDVNGVIYYRMTTGEFTKTLKMLKIK